MAAPQDVARLILNALRPENTAAQWLAEWQALNGNWDDLAVRAIVFGLAPQLYRRLSDWEIKIPPRSLAKLAVTHQAQAKRNENIYTQLDEVMVACQQRSLKPIGLKGVHLAAVYYAEPALRPMNDIDLLFTPEELPRAEEMLTELGYGGKHKDAELGPGVTKHTSTFKREEAKETAATPNPYLSAHAERMIEPHTSLEESWFGLKVDITPGIRERAVPQKLGQHECHVLASEDLLLHLCVHFCFHLIMGAPAMVQLTDLLVVTQTDQVDWPTFQQRAVEHRAAPYALTALSLAKKLLSAPIPAEALAQLQVATPTALRQRIAQLDLQNILKRTQQKPLNTFSQRLIRGLQDRAETARWAADWRGRWQVWQTAFKPSSTDTGQMLLQRK